MKISKNFWIARKIAITTFVAFVIFSPLTVLGAGLVPCDGVNVKCDYNQLVMLAQKIIRFLLEASVIIAMLLFTYAGFQLAFSGGDTGAMAKAKAIFFSAAKGLIIALAAWLIVETILRVLLKGEGFGQYIPLGGF